MAYVQACSYKDLVLGEMVGTPDGPIDLKVIDKRMVAGVDLNRGLFGTSPNPRDESINLAEVEARVVLGSPEWKVFWYPMRAVFLYSSHDKDIDPEVHSKTVHYLNRPYGKSQLPEDL